MEIEQPKTLIPALLLLAIAAADAEGQYDIKHKLNDLYEAHTQPHIVVSAGPMPDLRPILDDIEGAPAKGTQRNE